MDKCTVHLFRAMSEWPAQLQPNFCKPLGKHERRGGGVAFFGRHDTNLHFDVLTPRHSSLESRQRSLYSRRGNARREVARCVESEVGATSQAVPALQDLKDQLEGLHEEALQVRGRYNNARSRFMRLTEVARQLRQRAALDLKLGNEDSAKKVLIEKQKVIRAAELSKKRAHLLEELCTKLGEAISRKETQLIVSLSSPQVWVKEEPNVRVVSPKGATMTSFDMDLNYEGISTGTENPEGSPTIFCAHESDDKTKLEHISTDESGFGGVSLKLAMDFRDDDVEKDKSASSNKSDPPLGDLLAVEEEVDMSSMTPGRKNDDSLVASNEVADNVRDVDLQSEQNILAESYLGRVDLTSSIDRNVNSASSLAKGDSSREDDSEGVDGSSSCYEVDKVRGDIDPDKEGLLRGRKEDVGADDDASIVKEKSMAFKDYIQDMDYHFYLAESKLRVFIVTALNNRDMNAERLQLVEELLKQVQSLRARLIEAVREPSKQEL